MQRPRSQISTCSSLTTTSTVSRTCQCGALSRIVSISTKQSALTRRVSADCFVDIDTIRDSAPHWHVRETVEVVVKEEQVEIWLRGRCIAQHVRCYEPHTW